MKQALFTKFDGYSEKQSRVLLSAMLVLLEYGKFDPLAGVTPFDNAVRVLADGMASDKTVKWACKRIGLTKDTEKEVLAYIRGALRITGFDGDRGLAALTILLGGYHESFGEIAE